MQLKSETRSTLFVGNLPFDVSDEAIWAHFQTAGRVVGVRVVRDKYTKMGRGYGYVTFEVCFVEHTPSASCNDS